MKIAPDKFTKQEILDAFMQAQNEHLADFIVSAQEALEDSGVGTILQDLADEEPAAAISMGVALGALSILGRVLVKDKENSTKKTIH